MVNIIQMGLGHWLNSAFPQRNNKIEGLLYDGCKKDSDKSN